MQELWEARDRGDEEARRQLIEQHTHLIPLTVRRVVPRVPAKIDVADLEQEAAIALIHAVDRYEPARGVKFTSFALTWMRGACLEHLRNEDWVPRSQRDRQKRGEPATIYELVSFEDVIAGDEQSGDRVAVVMDHLIDAAPGPEEIAFRVAADCELWESVAALPERELTSVAGYYAAWLTDEEIGTRVGRSHTCIHYWRKRGLAALRQQILAEW